MWIFRKNVIIAYIFEILYIYIWSSSVSIENQYEKHDCSAKRKFRQYSCFMTEMRTCEWFGHKKDVLTHCREKHAAQVLENPASFVHDISRTSVHNYLMTAFIVLFLIHTKVSLKSRKIYHCVRLLADSGRISDHSYTLDISNEANNLTKKGVVAAEGCLAIKDSDSVTVSTNTLIELY